MPFYKNRMKYVNSKLWRTGEDTLFPEKQELGDKAKVGVCFSGGGTRSASCTHGQLRALNELGLLEKIGYFSCVSGGSWAALPFTFLNKHYQDAHFLGEYIEPTELSLDVLESISDSNYLQTVTNATIIDNMFKHWGTFAGDETYARAIGDVFLTRFGLNNRKKLFAYNEKHRDEVLERNPNLLPGDFYLTREGRPFLIASGALLRPGKGDYVFEMTPWYTGVGELHQGKGAGDRDIGGGYIESFAVDSDAPDHTNTNGTVDVRLGGKRHRFTLSDVIGTSGAAPSEVLNFFGLDFVGFPEFKHWPLTEIGETSAKEYEIGDGGNIENLGIVPLLRRGVERIVIFVNSKKKMYENGNDAIDDAVISLFKNGSVNQVFDASKLADLRSALRERLTSEQASIHEEVYDVMENVHHGIEGGSRVRVLWVYNNIYKSWKNNLPEEVRHKIGKSGKLNNFPHFKTFGENLKAIDLFPIQANLLSQMSSAVIMDNRDDFKGIING